jgi:ParB/RepB/Spo0J family partition protein
MSAAKVIDIGRIVADPDQPRKTFDAEDMALLAGSLRDHGQRDPVKVRWDAGRDRWVLIDGERRWRAAQTIGLTTLSAVIEQQLISSDRVLELQLVENALRTGLTPLEAGAAYQQLMAVWNCNQKALAQRLHISESKVSRSIDALNLPVETKAAVEAGTVGVMTAVKEARRKPAAAGRRAAAKPIRISTDAFDRIHDIAPGWDRYALESLYLGWAADKEPARNEDARFLGWVRSYTKGRRA